MTEFDYGSITLDKVRDVELPKSARGAGRTRNAHPWDNVITTLLSNSRQTRTKHTDGGWTGQAKEFPVVPADKAVEVERLVRYHAGEMQMGSTVTFQNANGQRLNLVSVGGTKAEGAKRSVGGKPEFQRDDGKTYKGNVRVIFAAKAPKQYKPREAVKS